MKKSDLKYGNIVELRDGTRLIYSRVCSQQLLIPLDGNGCLDYEERYINGLKHKKFCDLDIMKVYKDYTCKELLWEREKEPKLTEDEKDPCAFLGAVSRNLNLLKTILKKKVNIFDVWRLDTYEEYKNQYRFGTYHAEKDILTKSEFNLLKEVLENGK